MTIKLGISFLANLFAVILMGYQMLRINKLSGENGSVKHYFRQFSMVVLLAAVLCLLKSYADLQLGGITPKDFGKLSETDQALWYCTEVGAWIIDIFLSTVLLYMWITFLSWYLFEDKDFIRRKFWVGFTPLLASAVVTIVSVPMAIMSDQGYRFFVVAICVFFVVRIFYFLISLWLLWEYKKQNGYLRFFNPWAFFIPVFAGALVQDLFDWGFASLGSAVGMMLLYNSIVRKERYIDPDTGFYNTDFIGYLKELIKENRYNPGSAVTFTLDSAGKMKDFSEALKSQLPKDCEPILKNDSVIVVLTNVTGRGPLNMLIEDVKDVFEVNAGCTLKKKAETTDKFMERVL